MLGDETYGTGLAGGRDINRTVVADFGRVARLSRFLAPRLNDRPKQSVILDQRHAVLGPVKDAEVQVILKLQLGEEEGSCRIA